MITLNEAQYKAFVEAKEYYKEKDSVSNRSYRSTFGAYNQPLFDNPIAKKLKAAARISGADRIFTLSQYYFHSALDSSLNYILGLLAVSAIQDGLTAANAGINGKLVVLAIVFILRVGHSILFAWISRVAKLNGREPDIFDDVESAKRS